MSRVPFFLLLASAAVATSPSLAADLYRNAPAAPAYDNSYQAAPSGGWTGPYVGVNGGYAWGSHGSDGGQFGVYGGYNASVGQNVVVGGEADLNISGQSKTVVRAGTGPNGGSSYDRKSDWNGSIRGRVGMTFDKIMPYATAGIAFADNSAKGYGDTSTKTQVGYAVGAGVEGQVADRVTVKGEYLHEGFGNETHLLDTNKVKSSASNDIVRAGVAYHF